MAGGRRRSCPAPASVAPNWTGQVLPQWSGGAPDPCVARGRLHFGTLNSKRNLPLRMMADESPTVSTTKPSIVSPSWTSLLLIMHERPLVPPDMTACSFSRWAERMATVRSSVGSGAFGVTRADPPAGAPADDAMAVVG